MALDKDRIHELVEIFYQKPPFKTFYVNSSDGKNFCKPLGVFISLGITTSMKVLTDIRDVLARTPGITASIVEISSVKSASQFMNSVTRENITEQYEVLPESVYPNVVLSGPEIDKELENLESTPGNNTNITKLKESISRMKELPDTDRQIMRLANGEGYRVFHRSVNYKKENNIEYRIGIYVEEIS